METTILSNSRSREQNPHATLARGLGWGLIGGLVGTLSMDLLLMGVLFLVGLPILTCFQLVGDTAQQAFSRLGIEIAGGILVGVTAHYLIGPAIGAIFGAIMARVGTQHMLTPKKCIVLSVVSVEIVSQPLLALTALLLKLTETELLEWYGGALVMHFLMGIVLAVIVSRGLRLAAAASHQ